MDQGFLSDTNFTDDSSSDESSDDESITQFPQFNDLPPEIKEHIISQRRMLIPAFSLVNRELHELSKHLYLRKVGTRSFRYHEVATYLGTKPLIFGTHVHICHTRTNAEIKANVYIWRPDNINHPNGYWNIGGTMETNGFDAVFRPHCHYALDDAIDDLFYYLFYYDYLTQYHILSKRHSCVRLRPSYAKDYILHYFDRWYRRLGDENEDRISFYQILWMNAYVFNIIPAPKYTFNQESDEDILAIINIEIPRLYTAIRKAILKLD